MIALPLALAASFALCLLLVPFVSRLARQAGLLDRPDGRRKIHSHPVPLVGGLAILLAIGIPLLAAVSLSDDVADWFAQSNVPLLPLLGSATVLCLVGVIDDRFTLRGRHKLVGQLLAVSVLLASGVVVRSVDLFGL